MNAKMQLMRSGCTVPPALLPRMVRMGQGRKPELVFHPSLAYQRLLAENERLAGELIDLHQSGLLVRQTFERTSKSLARGARAVIAHKARQRHRALKAKRARYQTDPVYRASKLARAKADRDLIRQAKQSTP